MSSAESQSADDRAIWNRLDELEREEAENLAGEEKEGDSQRNLQKQLEGDTEEALETAKEGGVVKDGQLRSAEEARATSCSNPLHITVRHTGDTMVEEWKKPEMAEVCGSEGRFGSFLLSLKLF